MLMLILLLLPVPSTHAYKIKRTECKIEAGSEMMYCTCGGIGDPFAIIMNRGPNPALGVPYYGTRFGNNFAQQIKQALVERNRTSEFAGPPLKKVIYRNCLDYPFRLKLDFAEFSSLDRDNKVDLRSVEEIEFSNLHSVNLYLYNQLSGGNLTLNFNNIANRSRFNDYDEGSVVIKGRLNYCSNSCLPLEDDEEIEDQDNPAKYCDFCKPHSSLTFIFKDVFDVLLSQVIIPLQNHGQAYLTAENVVYFRVEGGEYSGLTADLDVQNCTAFEKVTQCAIVFDEGSGLELENGVAGVVVAACAVILVFLIVLGAVTATRPKSM